MSVLGIHYSKQTEEHSTATIIWCSQGIHSDCAANSCYHEKGRIDDYVKNQIEISPKDCKVRCKN